MLSDRFWLDEQMEITQMTITMQNLLGESHSSSCHLGSSRCQRVCGGCYRWTGHLKCNHQCRQHRSPCFYVYRWRLLAPPDPRQLHNYSICPRVSIQGQRCMIFCYCELLMLPIWAGLLLFLGLYCVKTQ